MSAAVPHRRRRVARAVLAIALTCALPWLGERGLSAFAPFPFAAFDRVAPSLVVLASDGSVLRVVANARGERQIAIELDEVSPWLVSALVAAEDRRFFAHGGVDWIALGRALVDDVAQRRIVSGASTLTLQLARIAEPRPRTLVAKAIECFRARQLERAWDKRRILREYVNQVPIGGVRGFEAAARLWFGKPARALEPAEAATLVAMLPAPSRLKPPDGTQELRTRRDRVLLSMAEAQALDAAELSRALSAPLAAAPHAWPFAAPWWCDEVIAAAGGVRASGGPLATTLDPALQCGVEAAVARSDDAGADGVAVVVVSRGDAAVRALVGGRDWAASKVDGAVARRDAGSTLKPFVYALAMEAGAVGGEELLLDAPVRFGDFAPGNFDGRFVGAIVAGDALAQSRNVPAVRLLDRVGTARFAGLLRDLGLDPGAHVIDLSAALGTLAVAPLELARAYARFADEHAELPLAPAVRRAVLAALADHSPLPGLPERRGIAWKTGTSSGRRDAWCVAITPTHVVVAWKGELGGAARVDLVGLHAAAPLCAAVVAGL